jgi:hypothetical protein
VSVLADRVSICGGYNTIGDSVKCIVYNDGGTAHRFVELDKNAAWFLKGVGGIKTQKGI